MKPIIAVSSLSQTKSPPYTRAGGVILWAMGTLSLSIAFSTRNGSTCLAAYVILRLWAHLRRLIKRVLQRLKTS